MLVSGGRGYLIIGFGKRPHHSVEATISFKLFAHKQMLAGIGLLFRSGAVSSVSAAIVKCGVLSVTLQG